MGSVFERLTEDYDRWYDRYPLVYRSELAAVRRALPRQGRGLEIGVGTGRFAAPLGIAEGIDPADRMLDLARRRGVRVRRGRGEKLPCRKASYDYVVLVVTLCFVSDPLAVLREAYRVLKPGGAVVVAILERESAWGRRARAKGSPFYQHARFFSVPELRALLSAAGFGRPVWWQTLRQAPGRMARMETPCRGTGKGGFVVVRARRPAQDPTPCGGRGGAAPDRKTRRLQRH